VDFEIVDENEDGILEFGENIVLRNIRVENSGIVDLEGSDSRRGTFT
jgi:hypothetical protein